MTEQPLSAQAVSEPSARALKVCHWTIQNGSGMHRVAESLAQAETQIGLGSVLADPSKPETWDAVVDADVHVIHTHFPNPMRKKATKPYKLVWIGHGTPDHVFHSAAEEAERGAYGHGDAVMLMQHWLREADARVTFWPRHKAIYDCFLTKGARQTDCVPMGVDTAFWKDGQSQGKYAGEPSVFTAENPHYIKWPYDLMTAWPWVVREHPLAQLHALYLPRDMHRTYFPWINGNGTAFNAYVSPSIFGKDGLRNAFQSVDFFVGLVRYGDHNHLCMQANAAKAKTISYWGNPYSDFWIREGDQREMARELTEIFAGHRAPRDKTPVPDIVTDTAPAMRRIYEDLAP